MNRVLYLVRHSKAEGQEPEAALTAEGRVQAETLANVLADLGVDRIVSSTFRRAVESIQPLADRLTIPIDTDERLIEASQQHQLPGLAHQVGGNIRR
jgi:2,3-bisphosphoglycerate-dependent phosphoglycerate mutase